MVEDIWAWWRGIVLWGPVWSAKALWKDTTSCEREPWSISWLNYLPEGVLHGLCCWVCWVSTSLPSVLPQINQVQWGQLVGLHLSASAEGYWTLFSRVIFLVGPRYNMVTRWQQEWVILLVPCYLEKIVLCKMKTNKPSLFSHKTRKSICPLGTMRVVKDSGFMCLTFKRICWDPKQECC